MKDNFVDLVITSPPYNLNKKASGGGSSKRNYDGWYPDDMPEEEYQDWQKRIIKECLRVSKGSVFYNHRVRYAWHSRNKYRTPSNIYHPMDWLRGFPIWSEIIWDRGGTTGHANKRPRMADERIYQLGKPAVFNDMGYTSVWKINPSKNIGHVCTFPEELVKKCIKMCSNEGDIILDPFMGSGTTGVVCKNLNRDFIGIELDKNSFNVSVKSIKEAQP
jgi:DNA modification methylase